MAKDGPTYRSRQACARGLVARGRLIGRVPMLITLTGLVEGTHELLGPNGRYNREGRPRTDDPHVRTAGNRE